MTQAVLDRPDVELEDLFDLDVRELPAEATTRLELDPFTSTSSSFSCTYTC